MSLIPHICQLTHLPIYYPPTLSLIHRNIYSFIILTCILQFLEEIHQILSPRLASAATLGWGAITWVHAHFLLLLCLCYQSIG